MILFRYIFGRVVSVFLFTFVTVLFLIMMMDLVELLRRGSGQEGITGILIAMAALHAPSISMKTVPFVMLLSGMWAYMQLARSSELVAARAAGHTYWSAARAGMVAATLIGMIATMIYGPLASVSLNAYERLEVQYLDGAGSYGGAAVLAGRDDSDCGGICDTPAPLRAVRLDRAGLRAGRFCALFPG